MLAFSDGGYTTNLPLADVTGGKAWVAVKYDGVPLAPSTADPRGSSCRTSTSGRARSGCGGCSSWSATKPGSGNRSAITTTGTRGASSGTQ